MNVKVTVAVDSASSEVVADWSCLHDASRIERSLVTPSLVCLHKTVGD